ncbi:MAG: nucleotide exchange factor GrpE [Nitrospirae bacterium]|jgi:molecular chaperone GrpE|nr:nucleotide exchange factor GrpE [Nitrospirota bacterium]
MQKRESDKNQLISQPEETEDKISEHAMTSDTRLSSEESDKMADELRQINDKYLRLYAEFENYKKRVSKDKEELIKYGNENLIYQLLSVIDSLELALKHASNEDVPAGFMQGVEFTLKELKKILGKFGLSAIDAEGKPFDPSVHHAMTVIERDDIEENTVVEEMRKGYMLQNKVLRPALVTVSKRPAYNTEESEKE